MKFEELKIGDTFEIEDKQGVIKYIKIREMSIYDGESYVNAVCIDEYRDEKGNLETIYDDEICSHVNWS